MTKAQLQEKLGYFLDPGNGIGAALYFVVSTEGGVAIKFADIEDNAKQELKDRYLEYISSKFFPADDEFTFLGISTADERKNVIYHYDLEERPEALNILTSVLENEEQDHFQFNEHNFNDIQGYLITIGNDEQKLTLYKKHHPFNLLRQDRFLLIPSNERLVKVNNDAIALDNSFDFMQIDDSLIIMKLNILERYFGFENVIVNQAQLTINFVQENNFLEDIQQLQDMVQTKAHARKLMKIRNSPVLNIPVQTFIDFIKNHPELTGKISFNDNETRIKLTTTVSKKLFLKALNDDYLFSQLTNLQYESLAKDRLNN